MFFPCKRIIIIIAFLLVSALSGAAEKKGKSKKEIEETLTLEELKLARTMAAECYPYDGLCGGMVGNAIWWRMHYAKQRIGRPVKASEVITTPAQFSGITPGVRVPSIMDAMDSTFFFAPFARAALNGEFKKKFPPFVLYATKRAMAKTKWGQLYFKSNKIMEFGDGHLAVIISPDGKGSYFVLPR